jgi:hypothetical protein
MTIPFVLLLGAAAFLAVKYGKTTLGGVLLGVLLGMGLMTTAIGPPIYGASQTATVTVFEAIGDAVSR